MELKIRKLTDTAMIPKYAHPTDSGLDLCLDYPNGRILLNPGQRIILKTGIAIKLPENTEAQIRPRSGLAAKQGFSVLNTPGTIDEGYTGEIMVLGVNFGDDYITFNHGDKIAQMVICPVLRPSIVEVDELVVTDRGVNGFGSTGV